jgi:predicted dehydrogenase
MSAESLPAPVGLRWGICGTSSIADDFVNALKTVPGATITAIGSRSLESATVFGERHGIPLRFGSSAELAASPDVDVVYVSVLNPYHTQMARLFIDAGKHVLVEKPFGMNAAQVSE